MSRAATEYRYEKLTWPEINDAVDLGKVCIVPCGAVEQHGHHLPLDVDLVCPCGIANGAGREIPDKMLVLPVVAYGYTGHVMDFPGTINTDFEHFMHQVLDITKIARLPRLQEDHPAQRPRLEHAEPRPRRPAHEPGDRRRVLPRRVVEPADGGQDVHAEVAAEQVPRRLRACLRTRNEPVPLPRRRQRPQGPHQERRRSASTRRTARSTGSISSRPARRRSISWTSSYSDTGVLGEAELATPEKGRQAYEEAVKQLVRYVTWWKDRPKDVRKDRHRKPPTMPIPWGQRPVT